MRSSARTVLLVFGAVIAASVWFAHDRRDSEHREKPSTAHAPDAAAQAPSRSDRQPTTPASVDESVATSLQQEPPASAHSSAAGPMQHVREPAKAFSTASANEMLADLSMDTQSGAQDTETPTDDEPLELEKLSRINCQFGAGSNTGLVWEGRTTVGTAEWQGGPIIFDSIDLTAGTAQMLGNVGAIGSAEGQVASRVIARGGRLEFLSALKTGPLVLTTIYGNLDEQGGYVATMSRHEGGAHSYASQFLGSCK